MYEIADFKGIVKKLSYNYSSKNNEDIEDVEQELYCKLVKIWPRINTMPKNEVFKFTKTVLNNHTIDLIRKSKSDSKYNKTLKLGEVFYYSNKQGKNREYDEYDLEEAVFHNLEKDFGYKFDQMYYSNSAESMLLFKDLKQHILNWSYGQDKKTRMFIKEFIDPSDETVDCWTKMVESNPAYKQYNWIPAYAYSKILGLSRMKIYRIITKMRNHLEIAGFRYQ